MKTKIAVLSYNSIPPYNKGINKILGENILFLPNSFNPKCPASVLSTDLNWIELIKHKNTLEKIIIFIGKKSSGSLEIIELACDYFQDKKEILLFILCDHEQEEKESLLAQFNIPITQYICFKDGHLPCQETPFLKGFLLDYLQNNKK